MSEQERQARLSRELFLATFTPPGSSELESWLFQRLMTAFEELTVEEGEVLFSRGEPPYYIYFIRDGSFRLEREGAASLIFNGRWVLGSFDVLAERPRSRTAIAQKRAEVARLRVEDWTEILEDSFQLARNVLANARRAVASLYDLLPPDGGFGEPRPAGALSLPSSRLDLIERSLVLMETPLLRGMGVQSLTDLAARAEEVAFQPGQVLAEAGKVRDHLFVVAEGIFEARRERPALEARFGPGSIVFGAAALGDHGLPWSARALTDARVLVVSVDEWFDQLEEHFEAIRAALSTYALERERLLDLLANRQGELVMS